MAGWTAIVLAIPWVCFGLIGWVSRMDTNAAGAGLILVREPAIRLLFRHGLLPEADVPLTDVPLTEALAAEVPTALAPDGPPPA